MPTPSISIPGFPEGTRIAAIKLPVSNTDDVTTIYDDHGITAGQAVEGGIKVKDASGKCFPGAFDPAKFRAA